VVRLLIVEDEPSLAETLAKGLRRRGFAVDVATDGTDGLGKALVNDYDVVVLDRDLPGVHGDEVCRRLNAEGRPARVIMLTAASSLDDLVGGLSLGADDYLTKPFRFAELVARVEALGRRGGASAPPVVTVADLVIDVGRHEVIRAGEPVRLTARELAVLELLARADGRTVSAEELLEKAWDDQADPFTTSVRVIISRLRSKLGQPSLIHTVIGRGYRMAAE
jgi:DNA-binding response OmpR family regulator